MVIIIAPIIAVLLVLYSSTLQAKPYGATLCKNDAVYSCYTIKRGDNWEKLFHDPEQRDLVMRINRINIRLYPGLKIAIPNNLNDANSLDYSPFRQNIDPPGEKVIIVSLKELAFGAYGPDGRLIHWGPVSGGKGYCPDTGRRCRTPTGHYAIYSKQGFGCISTKYPVGRGGAKMPYCMFFHGGFALHGSYDVPGYNASHGCVRMFVNDAEWLNHEFTADEPGVAVVISQN